MRVELDQEGELLHLVGESLEVDAKVMPQSRNKPTCPICRGSLSTTAPMVPNFAMDSIVEKHIHILAETGSQEWVTESDNYRNWQQRKKYVIASRDILRKVSNP